MNWISRSSDYFNIHALESVDSTNEEIKRFIKRGEAEEGLVVAAVEQTKGKGRHGRTWVSEPGNLFLSIYLTPECSTQEASQLSFVTACAALEALSSFANVTFKWPNDLLLEGRKVGGILLESSSKKNGMLEWVIIGMGINILDYPHHTDFKATSLSEILDTPVDKEVIQAHFLERLSHWYLLWMTHGFKPVRHFWLNHAHQIGSELSVRLDQQVIQGTFQGVSEDGSLLLESEGGSLVTVEAGDVYFNETA